LTLSGNYEVALSNKENIDNEIVRRWVDKASQKRKLDEVLGDKENIEASQKKEDLTTRILEKLRSSCLISLKS
jgi:hypothetical protein